MKRRYAMAPLVCALALPGCEPKQPSAVRQAPQPSASASEDAPLARGVFESKRFGMRLTLPQPDGWKIDDSTSSWLSAHNKSEHSTLLVRVWREGPRMSRDKCEALARVDKTLPGREGSDIVDSQRLELPEGFDTMAEVGLVPTPDGKLYGFVMAFGGWSRRCFAYIYVTEAQGPEAQALVGDRLGRMVEGSLQRLHFQRDFQISLERDDPSRVGP